ncbi:MAG: pectate lyase [Verrucomicrobiales bacterium]
MRQSPSPIRSGRVVVAVLICLFGTVSGSIAEDTPEVVVSKVRRVFDDGQHNAFTDLVVFENAFYLACRSCPDGHGVSPNASIVILSSRDGDAWETVHQFSVPRRDTRDPHFLVFDDRLFVYTGTWFCGDGPARNHEELDLNQHLGYAVVTDDGRQWSEPTLLEGTFGHYIWRAAAHGGRAYLCARRKIDFQVGPHGEPREVQSLMLESDDGLIWRKRATFQEVDGDETAFLFERNGDILGVGRRHRGAAELLRSAPPYDQWERTDLGRYIGGPLLARWGGRTVVGGRHNTDEGPVTSLCWLDGDQLTEFARLPSAGDNSYPGFVSITPTKALVSWYSSHEENNTNVYLAELSIADDPSQLSKDERRRISGADQTLARQRSDGGWPKDNEDESELELLFTRDQRDSTLDNGSTHRDLRRLAEAYTRSGLPRFRHGCLSGIEFLLESQYANGGWPQRYPIRRGYPRHITFNDGAMVGALAILHDISRGEAPFAWCDDDLRMRALEALDRGIDCILRCQITSGGNLTAWGQQHDEVDFSPRAARTFEPASLCSSESVGILRFLMQLEEPGDEVIAAIEAAIAWLDGPAKLGGIRQIDDKQLGKKIVEDPTAEPLWARLYEIGTNRPIFGDRDGQVHYQLSDISEERREGYSWYVESPRKLLEKDYPIWIERQR